MDAIFIMTWLSILRLFFYKTAYFKTQLLLYRTKDASNMLIVEKNLWNMVSGNVTYFHRTHYYACSTKEMCNL